MIIFKNFCEIYYYKHEHVCVFMLIDSDVYLMMLVDGVNLLSLLSG